MPSIRNVCFLLERTPISVSAETDNGPLTTDASFWRILFSPGGPGHVLFLQSELTNNQQRVYTDNIAMTRWLQEGIPSVTNQAFGNLEMPWIEATFKSSGDLRSFWTETVKSREEEVSLTWYSLGEAFLSHSLP